MIERVLDQRYRLEELIGSGGMADVYKAADMLLGRTVAVKILHDQFKRDTEFVEKFQREAQAAARLSHPNIVNIYDVGVSEGDHYIVMEYVPGKTLKDRIRQSGALSEEESLHIAHQIAEALAHAHANGLVHCDIKPHNILMMPDGHIKVADFGIARAVTESTMTYSGNVVGSVHYLSPEQVKGIVITPKSDVYSLGVVLYEMLTGTLPFQGETPVSIAMKHLQEQPPSVRMVNPAISPVTESLVVHAMEKDPERRPTSEDFVQEIAQAERALLSGSGQMMRPVDPDATQVIPRSTVPVGEADGAEDGEGDGPSTFKRKTFIIGLVFVLILGFFVGAFMSYGKFWSTEEVEVPDVTGRQLALARQILEDKKLRVDVQEEFNSDVPPGQVFAQDPEAGSKVKEDRLVTIKVSKGGEEIEMPDLVGLSKSDAISKIQKMGLKPGSVYEKYSDKEPGTVISQDPRSGSKLKKGDTVDITVSKGEETKKVQIPNVVGETLESAEATIKARGLSVGTVTKKTSSERAGRILSQSPASGEAAEGASIDLVVSEAEKKASKTPAKQESKQETGDEGENVPSQSKDNGKTR